MFSCWWWKQFAACSPHREIRTDTTRHVVTQEEDLRHLQHIGTVPAPDGRTRYGHRHALGLAVVA